MAHDEPFGLIDIGPLGVKGRVVMEHLSDVIKEVSRLTFGGGKHSILLQKRHKFWLIMDTGQYCPKTKLLSHYQGKSA